MFRPYDCSREDLAEMIAGWGFAPRHAAKLWSYLYREELPKLIDENDLPRRLRERFLDEADIAALPVEMETHSSDGFTRKYLLGLRDARRIETVLMRFRGRETVCLSSQVGCALGCVFCATGRQGFTRNLTVEEIIGQVLHADRVLRDSSEPTVGRAMRPRVRNLVVMGMGEPLLNYDAVMKALEICRDPGAFSIAAKRITVSTVGVVPGIVRLADEARPYSLAVSLHAATQEERAAMLPVARSWPLDALMEACRLYVAKLDRRIFFEWTVIAGTNDSVEQAHALARLMNGLPAHINLIPLNPIDGCAGAPGRSDAVSRFQTILRDYGIPSTVRQRRGIDIAAGCGQLAGVLSLAGDTLVSETAE